MSDRMAYFLAGGLVAVLYIGLLASATNLMGWHDLAGGSTAKVLSQIATIALGIPGGLLAFSIGGWFEDWYGTRRRLREQRREAERRYGSRPDADLDQSDGWGKG